VKGHHSKEEQAIEVIVEHNTLDVRVIAVIEEGLEMFRKDAQTILNRTVDTIEHCRSTMTNEPSYWTSRKVCFVLRFDGDLCQATKKLRVQCEVGKVLGVDEHTLDDVSQLTE